MALNESSPYVVFIGLRKRNGRALDSELGQSTVRVVRVK